MAEALPGVQDPALTDQDRRDGVAQAVQRDVAVAVPAGEVGEPVP